MLHIKPTDEEDLAALHPSDLVDAVEVFDLLLQVKSQSVVPILAET